MSHLFGTQNIGSLSLISGEELSISSFTLRKVNEEGDELKCFDASEGSNAPNGEDCSELNS